MWFKKNSPAGESTRGSNSKDCSVEVFDVLILRVEMVSNHNHYLKPKPTPREVNQGPVSFRIKTDWQKPEQEEEELC